MKIGENIILIGIISGIALWASQNKRIRSIIYKSINQPGLDFIKQWEGFRQTPYDDVAGHPTIGFGTLITPGHRFEGRGSITHQEAEEELKKYIQDYVEPSIQMLVRVPLNQNQFNALASFIYNLGPENFAKSTLLKKLNQKDYQGAAEEFPRWNKARVSGELTPIRGLTRRREAEKKMFLA